MSLGDKDDQAWVSTGVSSSSHDDERRRADRSRVSAVLVVDENPSCDREAAKLLIEFALPEVRALSRRRTLGQVREVLLWCAFAWNHAKRDTAQDSLQVLERDHGREVRESIEDLFGRRLREYRALETAIGALRVTRLRSGAVALHVDPPMDFGKGSEQ